MDGKGVLFVCPLCHGAFLWEAGSVKCLKGHTYDVARQGYINLLRKKPDTLYEDKALFAARRAVYEAGFFAPMIAALQERLFGEVILDAGCGEGSLLHSLCAGTDRKGIGMDIARPAVKMAAGAYKGLDFCVGDLCNIPLGDTTVDTLVNVLTPANYGEVARVLSPEGVLLKVVPNPGHLAEIRALAGKSSYTHTLEETLHVFEKRFALCEAKTIRYGVSCGEALSAAVYQMTPLTAHETLDDAMQGEITVDVTLLVGKQKN